jgi:hypothetical protein
MRRRVIVIMLLAASVHGAAALTSVAATDPLDIERGEDAHAGSPPVSAIWTQPPAQVQTVTAPPAPAPTPERTQSANPLWAIPLTSLSGTRDRPIFSSSRRPPAPAVAPAAVPKVAAVAKPSEPERPPLSLVGTIAGDDEGFGIFMDQSTRTALRLKVGEDYQGWKLRSVQGREATLEKNQQVVTLALPQPGAGQGQGQQGQGVNVNLPPPANTGKLLSATSQPRPNKPGR